MLPPDRIFFEEGQGPQYRFFLPAIDQRDIPWERLAQDGEGSMRGTGEGLIIGAVPAVLIVIAREEHFERPFRIGGVVLVQYAVERESGALARRHADHLMEKIPGIQRIETVPCQIGLVALGKKEQRLQLSEPGDTILPKVAGNIPGDIATEPVYIRLPNPVLHGCDHAVAQYRVIIVELTGIRPVERDSSFSRAILFVKIRVLSEPSVIGAGVIGHPIEDHL